MSSSKVETVMRNPGLTTNEITNANEEHKKVIEKF